MINIELYNLLSDETKKLHVEYMLNLIKDLFNTTQVQEDAIQTYKDALNSYIEAERCLNVKIEHQAIEIRNLKDTIQNLRATIVQLEDQLDYF